ncbi:MAG: glycerol-3-phosphate 1-O-acyltransferase, partial [Acidimicrobiales bacterium]
MKSLYITAASSPVEERILRDWIAEHGTEPSDVVNNDPAALRGRLEGDDGQSSLVALSVSWLPPERGGQRAARVSDLLRLRNPRRPRTRLQQRIVRTDPDRYRVIVAEPATVEDLQKRWADTADIGDAADADALAAFVSRQATLALDRAERAVIGTEYKVARLVIEELVDSRRWHEMVADLADEVDEPESEVAERAAGYLEEMVATHSRAAMDVTDQLLGWLARAYPVKVDESRLARLVELNRRHSLVFLPSHRSYLDPMILGPALHTHGLPPNHVLGGINVSFWPMGPLARRSGIVFIRRSFRDNLVYKRVLREYLAYLVRKRFNLEWYIEGGRTRTGKLRQPRYGILNYVVDAFRSGDVDDVFLVPTSIVYDQLHEAGMLAAEARGAAKPKENVGFMVKMGRAQQQRFGSAHVSFGEPLSMREGLAPADDPLAVAKLAFEVCHGINQTTPITTTSLVALALLGVDDRALTLGEVRAVLDPLLAFVEARRLPTTGESLYTDGTVTRTLEALARNHVVTRFDGGTEPVFAIGPDQHLVAAFYRNGAIHFFVTRAIAELVLAGLRGPNAMTGLRGPNAMTGLRGPNAMSSQAPDPEAEGLALRDLLKFEFFFADKAEFVDELHRELDELGDDWRAAPVLVAHRVLRSFLEAYLVVADRLAASDPRTAIDEDEFVEECEGVARQYRLQQRIGSGDSISRELFRTALQLAANRDLVDPGRDELGERRA